MNPNLNRVLSQVDELVRELSTMQTERDGYIRKLSQNVKLMAEMLDAFERLGNSPTARIDARAWAKHFKRSIKIASAAKTEVDLPAPPFG